MAGLQVLGRHVGREIGRQMQYVGLHRRRAVVHNAHFEVALLALVHVVELQVVGRTQQVVVIVWVRTAVVHQVGQHDAGHRDIDRFLRTVGIDGGLLVEVAQHAGVVSHADGELLVNANLAFGVLHLRAVAVGLHLVDDELAHESLVTQFEGGRDRHLVARSAYVDHRFRDAQALGLHG